MPSKTIIGIVSQIAGGKTLATEYLKQKHGAHTFRFSDMLRDVLKRMYLDDSRPKMQILSTILRQNFGDDIMSRVMANDVNSADHDLIITEGIRRPSDAVDLKKLPNFFIISIKADPKIRFSRLATRNDNPDDQTTTWEQFQDQANQESEQQIQAIADQADYVVENNGTVEELHNQLDEIMKKITNQ